MEYRIVKRIGRIETNFSVERKFFIFWIRECYQHNYYNTEKLVRNLILTRKD